MKNDFTSMFQAINECMPVEDIIITDKNVAFTFKGYLSNHHIDKLQQKIGIESFIIRTHNYNRNEIVFTHDSIFDEK